MVYKKKRYNYKKKTLKKSNIFTHKSAKSQAKQIYAINKKINYISKTTRPELQTTTIPMIYKRFIDANSRPIISDYGRLFFYSNYALNSEQTGHIDLQGDMMRVRYIKFFGQFGIFNDTSLSSFCISGRLAIFSPLTTSLYIATMLKLFLKQ